MMYTAFRCGLAAQPPVLPRTIMEIWCDMLKVCWLFYNRPDECPTPWLSGEPLTTVLQYIKLHSCGNSMHVICKPIDIFLYDQVLTPASEIPLIPYGLQQTEGGK